MKSRSLVICGPTATGKTSLGLQLARNFSGEIISADSRQVYKGRDIITGKDLPSGAVPRGSNLIWRGRNLTYYDISGVKLWLYDVVSPREEYNVSFWTECARLVQANIMSRSKLPIIVGGSGLYLKALIQHLPDMAVPPDPVLRTKLADMTQEQLFDHLNQFYPGRAAALNNSDRRNPRRLIRAIEIAAFTGSVGSPEPPSIDYLLIGMTAPREFLFDLVSRRITDRISAGARREDLELASDPAGWLHQEQEIVRHQLTWFKKMPDINWFDISQPGWQAQIYLRVKSWLAGS